MRTIKSNTTVYGEVKHVSDGKACVELHGKGTVTFDVTEEQAGLLLERISDTVGMRGILEWDIKTLEGVGFTLSEITPYKSGNVAEGFARIRELSSGFWDNMTDGEVYEYLKGD